ncbi:MAG TPA: IPT/TIG domain-containing protein [Candidatus Acidoferrales bacterium]|nr:IPT/TIG domain-containing protein [Candidatus Acidoferrales bacterium]
MKAVNTLKTILLAAGIALMMACGYSHSMTPPTAGTMPVIKTLNPTDVNHGTAAFSLEVDGTGFNSTAVVNFNQAAMATTWTNSGKVTAMIPASAIMNAGMVNVTVTNPAVTGTGPYGGGGMTAQTSTPIAFTIN